MEKTLSIDIVDYHINKTPRSVNYTGTKCHKHAFTTTCYVHV